MNDKPIRLPGHQLAMIILAYMICVAMFFKGMYEAAMQVHSYIFYHIFHMKLFMYGICRMGTAFLFIAVLFITFVWADKMHEEYVKKNHVQ